MGMASLGFEKGPSLKFRVDPTSVDFNYKVHSSVTETVGGRVVQITGRSLSDVVVSGSLGEDHGRGRARETDSEHPGVSWKLAEEFFYQIQMMMRYQSRDSSMAVAGPNSTLLPAVFVYAPLGLRFQCYIKSIVDPDGDGRSGVVHRVGRANHRYTLTLFPVLDGSTDLLLAGQSADGTLNQTKAQAVDSYISRISQGIGWRFTAYNGGSTPSSPWAKTNPGATPNSTLENP